VPRPLAAGSPRGGRRGQRAKRGSLYGDGLGQVARLVHIMPLGGGQLAGEDLQRHRGH